ncbi:hypothetical protein JCGZ_12484 [Jatropha curcas]|uniref:Uncharacterized protein n=1 Tax=Jatropha curcas TaxID=180498 RepID=A0A067KAH6_JATCU|nr:hypothetical protein JCGZ_12484 [Jatropha curcas]
MVTLLSRSERNRSSLRSLCQQVNGNGRKSVKLRRRSDRLEGEPRRILRRDSNRGKVAALPATVAFSRNERREGRGGRSCCGKESTARRRGAVLWSSENERRRGRG